MPHPKTTKMKKETIPQPAPENQTAPLASPSTSCSASYSWRDIGDGNKVRVKHCSMCGVAPSNVDDCGRFGDPDCPYFGIGREEYERREAVRNSKQNAGGMARELAAQDSESPTNQNG